MAKQRQIYIKGDKNVVFRKNGRVILNEAWDIDAELPRLDLSEEEAILLGVYLQEAALENDR